MSEVEVEIVERLRHVALLLSTPTSFAPNGINAGKTLEGQAADTIEALQADNAALTNIHACDVNDFVLMGLARDDAQATIEAQARRIGELEGALRPFAEAASNIPADQEDFKVVAHVPGGQHAAAFRRLAENLTACAFRKAAALAPPGQEGAA